jgi:hypothetical protein
MGGWRFGEGTREGGRPSRRPVDRRAAEVSIQITVQSIGTRLT